MKKFFVLGLTVLALSFGFISCSDGDDGDDGGSVPAEFQGTWNHNEGHKVVIGEKSATLTRSGQSPITLPFKEGVEGGGSIIGIFNTGTYGNANLKQITLYFNPSTFALQLVVYDEVIIASPPLWARDSWVQQ